MRVVVLLLALAGCVPIMASPPAPSSSSAWTELIASPDLDGRVVGATGQVTVAVVMASWCGHCHAILDTLDSLRAMHPGLRVVGVSWREHEEYDDLGDPARLRAYVASHAPWLEIVAASPALYAALGAPTKVPTIYVFDPAGALVTIYDRRQRSLPERGELEGLFVSLGI